MTAVCSLVVGCFLGYWYHAFTERREADNRVASATMRAGVAMPIRCVSRLHENVPFGLVRAARSAPANGAPVATPQAPTPTGAAWAYGGSTPLATALLACHYDAPNKRGHF